MRTERYGPNLITAVPPVDSPEPAMVAVPSTERVPGMSVSCAIPLGLPLTVGTLNFDHLPCEKCEIKGAVSDALTAASHTPGRHVPRSHLRSPMMAAPLHPVQTPAGRFSLGNSLTFPCERHKLFAGASWDDGMIHSVRPDGTVFGYLGVKISGSDVWTTGHRTSSRCLGPLKGACAGSTQRVGLFWAPFAVQREDVEDRAVARSRNAQAGSSLDYVAAEPRDLKAVAVLKVVMHRRRHSGGQLIGEGKSPIRIVGRQRHP